MIRYFENLWTEVLTWANNMSMQDWAFVAVIVVAIGYLAMRGFGSRTSY